jgi:hypothetical protein
MPSSSASLLHTQSCRMTFRRPYLNANQRAKVVGPFAVEDEPPAVLPYPIARGRALRWTATMRPPGNIDRLSLFGQRLRRLWRLILRRRSQRRVSWERALRNFKRWLPAPRVLHPYPLVRFLATHPRWEPYA